MKAPWFSAKPTGSQNIQHAELAHGWLTGGASCHGKTIVKNNEFSVTVLMENEWEPSSVGKEVLDNTHSQKRIFKIAFKDCQNSPKAMLKYEDRWLFKKGNYRPWEKKKESHQEFTLWFFPCLSQACQGFQGMRLCGLRVEGWGFWKLRHSWVNWGFGWMKIQSPRPMIPCPPSRSIFWTHIGCGIWAPELSSAKGRGQVLFWRKHLIQEVLMQIGFGDICASAPWRCPWGPQKSMPCTESQEDIVLLQIWTASEFCPQIC